MIEIGERYQSSQPLDVTVFLTVAAPVTIMGGDVLPANEPFVVTNLDIYGKIGCRPENYERLHEHFMPQNERDKVNRAYQNRYEGYILLIASDVIANRCERLDA